MDSPDTGSDARNHEFGHAYHFFCDTLLSMSEGKDEEISHGLQTISTTGKRLALFL